MEKFVTDAGSAGLPFGKSSFEGRVLPGAFNKFFYLLKPLIPRWLQLALRRELVRLKLPKCREVWPIDARSANPPDGWRGWPGRKRFALVLTHDVDTWKGHQKCEKLISLEERLGFRSSFNFVPERYQVCPELRRYLVEHGFEVGVHGLNHDGKLFSDINTFMLRAKKINNYLKDWGSVGFRAPSMHHNLEWIGKLEIEYDASTFDTDPFEPQSDGVTTIFPFVVNTLTEGKRYIELPYTLPQDFTLFILMKNRNIDIWKEKLDWIVNHGGMALINTHPDYMNFGEEPIAIEEYSHERYEEFLSYVRENYVDECCHLLPCELVSYLTGKPSRGKTDFDIAQGILGRVERSSVACP